MPVMKYIKKTIPLITAAIMLTAFVHTAFAPRLSEINS